ncbi:MAG TPA: sigma-54 dependent transcriptional regulator [Thermodesulfobacteriota bacterium]|nr:sigma-54 dependent transcriptional regulator [Thermodesulfobacteriota bacterium]
MNHTSARLLVVDDDPVTLDLLKEVLTQEGYEVTVALGGEEAIARGMDNPVDIVITDVRMEDKDGMEVLRTFKRLSPETTVIMITAFGSIETAIEAIREGAFDYISKPFKLDEITLTLRRALEQRRLLQENKFYRQDLLTKYEFKNVIGQTPSMVQVYKTIAKVADTKSTVLLCGESGTGKELIARSIHDNSPRNPRPFIPVDCASLVENLLESELFGHVRGAFTGAVGPKKGLFEEAEGGTLFLDEVANISLSMQTKLLRFLQEHEIKRVGGTESVKVDVRIISATNQQLEPLVKDGKFREDLFYRLNVITIILPPLRERKEDIPLLANHFVQKFTEEYQKSISHISPEALDIFMQYSWPGNVRELENTIERAVIFSIHPIILPEDLPQKLLDTIPEKKLDDLIRRFPLLTEKLLSLKDVEKNYVLKVLQETKGNKKKAAEILGIDRTTLYRILDKN